MNERGFDIPDLANWYEVPLDGRTEIPALVPYATVEGHTDGYYTAFVHGGGRTEDWIPFQDLDLLHEIESFIVLTPVKIIAKEKTYTFSWTITVEAEGRKEAFFKAYEQVLFTTASVTEVI